MKNIRNFLLFTSFTILTTISCHAGENLYWKDLTNSIKDRKIKALAINTANPNVIFAGTSKGLYKSSDRGNIWKRVIAIEDVSYVVVDKNNTESVYIATSRGLYKSIDSGATWKRIFTSSDNKVRHILSIAIDPKGSNKIYIGTEAGLLASADGNKEWQVVTGIEKSAIYKIRINEADPNVTFLATSKGIYKSNNGAVGFDRVYAVTEQEQETESGDDNTQEDDPDNGNDAIARVNDIEFDYLNAGTIYTATNQGILKSVDNGGTWLTFSSNGLMNTEINDILVSDNIDGLLYVATNGGVYRFYKDSWRCLYKGLISQMIYILAFESKSKAIWAGTDNGVFRLIDNIKEDENTIRAKSDTNEEALLNKFEGEPNIEQVQKVAVTYAEVYEGKILEWRRKAQMKAALPNVSVGFDHDVGKDSYLTRGNYWYQGVNRGLDDSNHWGSDRNFGWDITLTWSLGDLVWNDVQTSIDTRSRLMVQLRDDILNEVNRLYFERRRIQTENLIAKDGDLKARIEQQLRIQELTAGIDALTGGYFSKALREFKDRDGSSAQVKPVPN